MLLLEVVDLMKFTLLLLTTKELVTGNAGTILEKHLALSKAKDAEFSVGSPSYWRKYLYTNSQYIFGGSAPAGTSAIAFSDNGRNTIRTLDADTGWDQNADGVNFGGCGVHRHSLLVVVLTTVVLMFLLLAHFILWSG